MLADAGVPDGMMAGVSLTAAGRLQIAVGVGHNSVSTGARVGARVDALRGPVSPFVAGELGNYPPGLPPSWAQSLAESAGLEDGQIDQIGYQFSNLHVGLRFGVRRASFFLQGGASLVSGSIAVSESRGAQQPLAAALDITARVDVRAWVPSGRLGFIAYF